MARMVSSDCLEVLIHRWNFSYHTRSAESTSGFSIQDLHENRTFLCKVKIVIVICNKRPPISVYLTFSLQTSHSYTPLKFCHLSPSPISLYRPTCHAMIFTPCHHSLPERHISASSIITHHIRVIVIGSSQTCIQFGLPTRVNEKIQLPI